MFRKTETNKQYGMVSSESKKDRRTVEQVQAEIRARKRQKVGVGSETAQGLKIAINEDLFSGFWRQ